MFDCGRPITLMTARHDPPGAVPRGRRRTPGGTRDAVAAGLRRPAAVLRTLPSERYGWDGSPIHDAVTVAHLAMPDLVRTEAYRVDVETTSELTRGRTVVDLYAQTGRRRTSTWASRSTATASSTSSSRRSGRGAVEAGRLAEPTCARAWRSWRSSGSLRRRAGGSLRYGRAIRHIGTRRPPRLPEQPSALASPGSTSWPTLGSTATRPPTSSGTSCRPSSTSSRSSRAVLIGVNDVVQGVPIDDYEANSSRSWTRSSARLPADRIVTVAVPGLHGHPGRRRLRRPDASSTTDRGDNAVWPGSPASGGSRCRHLRHLPRVATSGLVADDGLHPSAMQYGRGSIASCRWSSGSSAADPPPSVSARSSARGAARR